MSHIVKLHFENLQYIAILFSFISQLNVYGKVWKMMKVIGNIVDDI